MSYKILELHENEFNVAVLLLNDSLVGVMQILNSLSLDEQHLLIHFFKKLIELPAPNLLLLLEQVSDVLALSFGLLDLPLPLIPVLLEILDQLPLLVDPQVHLDLYELGLPPVVLGGGSENLDGQVVYFILDLVSLVLTSLSCCCLLFKSVEL